MDARTAIIQLGSQLAAERDAAFDLWTWLPSYKAAQAGHGDYASEHQPQLRDLLIEATLFIGHGLKPTEEQLHDLEHYHCPCGEVHGE
jgi:hypothetical protein